MLLNKQIIRNCFDICDSVITGIFMEIFDQTQQPQFQVRTSLIKIKKRSLQIQQEIWCLNGSVHSVFILGFQASF